MCRGKKRIKFHGEQKVLEVPVIIGCTRIWKDCKCPEYITDIYFVGNHGSKNGVSIALHLTAPTVQRLLNNCSWNTIK